MANRTIRTPEKGERLLKQLALGKSISAACRAEKIGRTAFYAWKEADPEFATSVVQAIEEGTDRLEDEANRRALRASDTLLIFLLKSRRPEKYQDRSHTTVAGDADQPLTVVVKRVTGAMS